MPITNNHRHPDKGDIIKPIADRYINYTSGVWLRHHIEKSEIELWYGGKLQTAYAYDAKVGIDVGTIAAFIADGIELGKRLRSKEIKDLING